VTDTKLTVHYCPHCGATLSWNELYQQFSDGGHSDGSEMTVACRSSECERTFLVACYTDVSFTVQSLRGRAPGAWR